MMFLLTLVNPTHFSRFKYTITCMHSSDWTIPTVHCMLFWSSHIFPSYNRHLNTNDVSHEYGRRLITLFYKRKSLWLDTHIKCLCRTDVSKGDRLSWMTLFTFLVDDNIRWNSIKSQSLVGMDDIEFTKMALIIYFNCTLVLATVLMYINFVRLSTHYVCCFIHC